MSGRGAVRIARMMKPVIPFVLMLAGCAQFPEVDAASRSVSGPAPALVPLDQVLGAPAPQAEARGAALAARAAALRVRAGAR